MKQFLIAMIAYAFFIVCPRLAAMTKIITTHTQTDIIKVVTVGTIFSLPLIILMTLIVIKYGLLAGLGFAVLTDILSAIFMREISLKAGLETFIIAVFVVVGSKVASLISARF